MQFFIGCACDPPFVDLTCTMLSSLEDNGDVPEADIIVADFDLSDEDRRQLRASAGCMGGAMRFSQVRRDSPLIPAFPQFDFPFPMLGRFVIPKLIDTPDARLLTLDSDMVVNGSLRPLFVRDMAGHPFGAIHDPLSEHELAVRGRKPDPDYFNTGLMLVDVDRWNERRLSDRAMMRLAEYDRKPEWPDQDALNEVADNDWLRLPRSWNLFYAGEPRQFTLEEYGAAQIVHFAGCKPSEEQNRGHPAIPLYDHHAARAEFKKRIGGVGAE